MAQGMALELRGALGGGGGKVSLDGALRVLAGTPALQQEAGWFNTDENLKAAIADTIETKDLATRVSLDCSVTPMHQHRSFYIVHMTPAPSALHTVDIRAAPSLTHDSAPHPPRVRR